MGIKGDYLFKLTFVPLKNVASFIVGVGARAGISRRIHMTNQNNSASAT
jgi:hypothetical protein